MPIPAQRTINPVQVRNFGRIGDAIEVPPLTDVQTKSYDRFLQLEVPPAKRTPTGLEGVLREIFPIESYDKTISLEYLRYELGKPRYDPDECRQLRLTYGRPFRVWLRLKKEQPVEEEVYLGDMPIMIGGGEFIINGAERVVVSQLHRSPGVDFVVETEASERKLHSCRIIPERGSWIEINVTKKDALGVRIDQSGKFSSMTLLRAMDEEFSTSAQILMAFYKTTEMKVSSVTATRLEDFFVVGHHYPNEPKGRIMDDIIDPETGEVLAETGTRITKEVAERIIERAGKATVILMTPPKDPLILASVDDDPTNTHQEALLRIYQRLRPGNPPQLEKAKELFKEKFQDPNRYRLGKVGRFRINRKFDQDIPETEMTLRSLDYLNAIRYILNLREGRGHVDDIDHLGNRRLRTIDELAADELRKGFLKLRRTVQERMSIRDQQDMTPRTLINRVFLWPWRAQPGGGPDQPAGPVNARAPPERPGTRRPQPQTCRLRSARRTYLALRPHLPHRDTRRYEHRLDFQPQYLRRGRRIWLPDHALPQAAPPQADRRGLLAASPRGVAGAPGARRYAHRA
jgi:DNA-directed RNA polymerase subunit beta